MARIGLLTGGGDCPGLNAVIRAVVRSGLAAGEHSFLGFRNGWAGVLENAADELTLASTAGILPRGGTILGTSRTNPYANDADGTAAVRATLERREVKALVAIGGEDTLGVALRLHEDGVPVVGVPKTIDNDLGGADATIVPERMFDIEEVCARLRRRHGRGRSFSIVVVAEGAIPKEGTMQTVEGSGKD